VSRSRPDNAWLEQSSSAQTPLDFLQHDDDASIECMADRLVDDALSDALSYITDTQHSNRSIFHDDVRTGSTMQRRRTVGYETSEMNDHDFQTGRAHSCSTFPNFIHQNESDIDLVVHKIAQRIYSDSFDQLRR
jgi:hypothetical protein